jgi:hypothetical protein
MGTCETCAHWGAPDERERSFEVRTCKAVPHDPNFRAGNEAADWDWIKEENPEEYARMFAFSEALAVVVDGSGYRGELKVRAQFGCALHASQEAAR